MKTPVTNFAFINFNKIAEKMLKTGGLLAVSPAGDIKFDYNLRAEDTVVLRSEEKFETMDRDAQDENGDTYATPALQWANVVARCAKMAAECVAEYSSNPENYVEIYNKSLAG